MVYDLAHVFDVHPSFCHEGVDKVNISIFILVFYFILFIFPSMKAKKTQ